MRKLIAFPVDIGRRIAAAAEREHRSFTGQVLHWLLKGEEAEARADADQRPPTG